MIINRFIWTLSHLRLWSLYFIALSPSLGTAVSALGRLVLLVLALCVLSLGKKTKESTAEQLRHSSALTVLLAISYMALSILWAHSDNTNAVHAWTRHARLLTIPVVYLLISGYGEARSVLRIFIFGQIFVVLSAWLLVWGVKVPWATSRQATDTYAVFGSYLEQSISQAVLIALLWHQRKIVFGNKGQWLAIAMAVITLVHTMGFLMGRSGHVVALTLIMVAVIYELPVRLKWASLLVPFVVLALAWTGSQTFRDRTKLVRNEISAFLSNSDTTSSSGQRLMFWRISLIAVQQSPVWGTGAGSWNKEYRLLEAGQASPDTLTVDNPHQLFLLWAVEGGIIGLFLLCAVFVELYIRSRTLARDDGRTLQAVIIALLVSGMLNSQIFGIGMGDFFCIAFGICLALVHGKNQLSTNSIHG